MDKDEALNTLAKVFHNGEEMEGDDGAVMVVDLALWNEGCEAIEALIGGEEDERHRRDEPEGGAAVPRPEQGDAGAQLDPRQTERECGSDQLGQCAIG